MDNAAEQRRRAFSVWMRTGRWPRNLDSQQREFKFNPWHDPKDGRFTFNGAGRYYGPGGAMQGDGRGQRVPKISYFEDARLPSISNREEVEAWKAEQLAKNGHESGYRRVIEDQYRRYLDKLARRSGNGAEAAGTPGRSAGQRGPGEEQPARSSNQSGFPGLGGSFGGAGASGSWEGSPAPQTSRSRHESQNVQSSWAGGGFTGGGGGSLGGGGASGSGDWSMSKPGPSVSTRSAKPNLADRSGASEMAPGAAAAKIFTADRVGKVGTVRVSKAGPTVEAGSFSWIHKGRYTTNRKLRAEWGQREGRSWPKDVEGRNY